jgi:pyruvate,water dikinase
LQVIAVCHTRGLKIGICGKALSDYPEFAQFRVEQGIHSISLKPTSCSRRRWRFWKRSAR